MNTFKKKHLDALFRELECSWLHHTDFEQLVRDAHLGIALADAGSPMDYNIDPRVASLIKRHKPGS